MDACNALKLNAQPALAPTFFMKGSACSTAKSCQLNLKDIIGRKHPMGSASHAQTTVLTVMSKTVPRVGGTIFSMRMNVWKYAQKVSTNTLDLAILVAFTVFNVNLETAQVVKKDIYFMTVIAHNIAPTDIIMKMEYVLNVKILTASFALLMAAQIATTLLWPLMDNAVVVSQATFIIVKVLHAFCVIRCAKLAMALSITA